MFARGSRTNWFCWGNQSEKYFPSWDTYKNHSQNGKNITTPYQNKKLSKITATQINLLEKKKTYSATVKRKKR